MAEPIIKTAAVAIVVVFFDLLTVISIAVRFSLFDVPYEHVVEWYAFIRLCWVRVTRLTHMDQEE